MAWRHAIAWAGLRGSIPIALALGVTLAPGIGPAQPELLTVVFGVVLASLLLQGLTISPLIRRLGLAAHDEHERAFERLVGERFALASAMHGLEELRQVGQLPPTLREELGKELDARTATLGAELQRLVGAHPELARSRRDDAVRALLTAERTALEGACARGLISSETLEVLQREIDARLERPTHVTFGPPPVVPQAVPAGGGEAPS